MALIDFPNAIYRGNNVNSNFSIANYSFIAGDKLIVGIKGYIGARDYIFKKEVTPDEGTETVLIVLLPEETKKLPVQKAILEITLVNEEMKLNKTVYQEEIELKGVVNDE